MTRYKLTYDYSWEAIVEVDQSHPETERNIRESVEFWSDWKINLIRSKGDYTALFLHNLTMTLLNISVHYRDVLAIIDFARNIEGWYPLDGSHGVRLVSCDEFLFDADLIEVEKI